MENLEEHKQGSSSEVFVEDNMKKKKNEEYKVAFYKLFSFADKIDVVLMIIGTISAIGNGISQPLLAVIFGQLINSFGTANQSQIVHLVSQLALKMLYLAIGTGVASCLQVTCWIITGERQSARIRGLYLKAILRQDIAFFDTETMTGEVIKRMSGDIILIQDALGEKVGQFIQLLSTFVSGFLIAFVKGWLLSLVLLGCIPCIVLTGGAITFVTSKTSTLGQRAYAEAGNVVEQTIGAMRTVQSFTGEKHAIEKYKSKLSIAYKATIQQDFALGFGTGVMTLVLYSTVGLTIWYGSKLVIEKGYQGGDVINILFSIVIGSLSLGEISPSMNAFAVGQTAAFKMLETIKRKPTIDPYDTKGVTLEKINGDIELKNVHFRYPSRPDVQIFSSFSLQVPSGTTAALVGQSGSGKSTVISLIQRFYDPDSGEVLIDGIDLKKMKLSWIREQIGLVSQEPVLFGTSIKENIAYGKQNATEQEITEAIELSNAAKFIDKLPLGLDTMVGEHGTQLSGGQKQRIAIARAILKNPKILLLDEATSALDAESERIVQDAVVNVMCNRTTIVVAHRLTTIRSVDMIVVVQRGKIVEKGTHNELIRDPEGAYTQLICLQDGVQDANDRKLPNEDALRNSFNKDVEINWSPSRRHSRKTSGGSPIALRSLMRRSFNLVQSPSPRFQDNELNVQGIESNEKSHKVSIIRLANLNKPEIPILLLGSVAAAANGVIFPGVGLLLGSSIQSFFEPPRKLHKDAEVWFLLLVGLGIVALLARPLQKYLFGIAGGKLIERISSKTFEKVVYQDISWFDDPANSSGALGARLSVDAFTIKSLVGDTLGLVVQNIATITSGLVIAFTANRVMASVILVVSPLLIVQGLMQAEFVKGFNAEAKLMYEEASQVANDALSGIRTIASFCAEEKVMKLYQEKCDGPRKHGVRLGLVSGIGFGFSTFILLCTQAFCFYIGSILVKHDKATFSEVFKVFYTVSLLALSVTQSTGTAPDTAKAKDSAVSIFAILDSKPKIDSSSDEGIILPHVVGNIKFEHVSFRYPTRLDVQIFRELSLEIASGQTVALVGESGSGKSTVINLIQRFYDPDFGQIYLDSIEIRKLKLCWLRQQMGLVSQEPVLFNETIRSNIAYGKKGDITEEEIIAAAKAANAHNFISSLPQGFSTCAGERGLQLSGGQKQRIAIARAIAKNPKILLLDEATSALDAESERIVQDALDSVMVNRTTVVIAHRLSTIKGADVIAIVKNGRIVEKGRHDDLMRNTDGAYASLVALQMNAT